MYVSLAAVHEGKDLVWLIVAIDGTLTEIVKCKCIGCEQLSGAAGHDAAGIRACVAL